MYMKTFKKIGTSLICALFATPMMAQQTYEEMEQLTVNEQVTTVITASEPIRFVDISTDMVCLPSSPLSQSDTVPNMPCSILQGFRRLLPTSKSSQKRRLPITIRLFP